MPELSRFYGITIRMYYGDHNPPHFHAKYGESEVVVHINRLSVISGELPSRALGLVKEWAALHQDELLNAWSRARNNEEPERIAPLD